MSNSNRTAGRNLLGATVAAGGFVRGGDCRTGARCARPAPARSSPTSEMPSEKILQCGETPDGSPGARSPLSAAYTRRATRSRSAIRLDDGALLIEFHPSRAAGRISNPDPARHCRGPRHEMGVDVTKARTSTLVLDGAVGVTNRRLNQYVIAHGGAGRRYHSGRHVHGPENAGERPECGRCSPVSESEWRLERPGPSRLLTGAFLAAALVVGGALGAQEINGLASPLDRIENLTLDWRFLLAGARPAPSGVVIVAIDDEALSEARRRCADARNDGSPRAGVGGFPSPIDRDRYRVPQPEGRGRRRRTRRARSRRRRPSSRRSAISTRSILQAQQPNRAIWPWRRSRPPFSGRSSRSAMRRKWGLPMFRPTRAECLVTFR